MVSSGDTCHFKHERKICNDSNCNIFNCNLRHPRICRWFQVYGRCKFTSFCKYKHTEIKSFEEIVTKIEHNDNKLADIDIILENLKKEEGNIMHRLEKYETYIESKLNNIFKLLEEKERKIVELEASVQVTRESLENLMTEKEIKSTTDVKKKKAPVSEFKCTVCDYVAKSSNGLRMHINRKHTKYDENETSFECENCGNKFDSAGDLKEHMIMHSYQKLQFKCDECNFWGPNEQTMKMHVKKNHSETISCGLCNFEANDIETLDTHTFTCEMYKCNECKLTFLHLDKLRSHMKNEHYGCGCLSHFKRQLINQEFFDETIHFASEIFSDEMRKK